jgi:CheY-like chemotaxis protein
MSQAGPIVIVEDDPDDQQMIGEAIKEIGIRNTIRFFDRGHDAFNYLKTDVQPFIILSDINLPEMNGVDFKRKIDSDPQLRSKSIPFVFFSTSAEKKAVDTAYKEMTVQGFFLKSNRYQELKDLVKVIMEYWKLCKHPNS